MLPSQTSPINMLSFPHLSRLFREKRKSLSIRGFRNKFGMTILSVSFLFFSCGKDKSIAPDLGLDYFPADVGHYVVYDVDSIIYNDNTGGVDSFHYQVKTLIASEFIDNAGRNAFRLERYRRNNDTLPWTLTDAWWGVKTNTSLEITEEDVTYVKLVFPVKQGSGWDGNALNSSGEQDYKYEAAHAPLTINNLAFDSAATVLQLEDINLIETKVFKETYAKHAGLVKKEITDLKTEVNGTIKSGLRYTSKVSAFGKE